MSHSNGGRGENGDGGGRVKPLRQFQQFENTLIAVVTMLKIKFIDHLDPCDTTPHSCKRLWKRESQPLDSHI